MRYGEQHAKRTAYLLGAIRRVLAPISTTEADGER
jgi:hypothetical protein